MASNISETRYLELEKEARRQAEMDASWPTIEGLEEDAVEGVFAAQDVMVETYLQPMLADEEAKLEAEFEKRDAQLAAVDLAAQRIAARFGVQWNRRGGVSQYLTIERPDGDALKVRISHHAPPVGRGGFRVSMQPGLSDSHQEADISVHPGGQTAEEAVAKIQAWIGESE